MGIQDIRNLLSQDPALNASIGPAVEELITQINKDKARGFINGQKYNTIIEHLGCLVNSASELDIVQVNAWFLKLKENCKYQRATCSKLTLLGFVIGAIIEGLAMLAITIATKGAAIPLWAIALNTSSAGLFGGFIGAFFGHHMGEYATKRKIDLLVGESIYHHFAQGGHDQAQHLKNYSFFSKVKEKISEWTTPAPTYSPSNH